MSFSFTDFGGNTAVDWQKGNTDNDNNSSRLPTERQYGFYVSLCKQRNMEPKGFGEFTTFDKLSKEIQNIRSFYPASEAQINLVKSKIQNLNNLGVNIQMPDVKTLTGGRDGTASILINSLIKMENEYKDKMPPSEAQLKYLVNMFLCPDVAFEEHNINKKVNMDGGTWRYMTPDEFVEEIKSKINGREASRFIDKHKNAFAEWRSTRVRPEQQRYIRVLEDRIAGKETPVNVEWVVNDKGKLEMKKTIINVEDDNKIWRLTEMQLLQFSDKQASQYIEMLSLELARKTQTESTTFESIDDERKTNKSEVELLEGLLHKLESIAGYEIPEIFETFNSLVTDGYESEEITKCRELIHEFMKELVEQDAIDLPSLMELCMESTTAQRILLGVA